MAKKHIWYYITDEEGRPVSGASVYVLLAGTEDPANVFLSANATSATATLPQLQSEDSGRIDFWIENDVTNSGYYGTQLFKMRWIGTDIDETEIDNINFLDTSLPVDETDGNNSNKNKLLSNQLAYYWEKHRNTMYKTADLDSTHKVHGIEQIPDWADLNDDSTKNKLISNKMMLEVYYINEPKPSAVNTRIRSTDWVVDDETGYFRFRIDHELHSAYLIIDAWDYDTNNRVVLYDYNINTSQSVTVYSVKRFNCRCVVSARRFDNDPTSPENYNP